MRAVVNEPRLLPGGGGTSAREDATSLPITGAIAGYLRIEAVVVTADPLAGASATLPASAAVVLAMPQQLGAGTTICDETIVSQQATLRYTSRPQLSYHATVSHAGAHAAGAQADTHTGSQHTGSQQTGSQQCRRCQRPASASLDVANPTTQAVKPNNRTKNFRLIEKTLGGARASRPRHLRGAAIPGAATRYGGPRLRGGDAPPDR